MATDNKRAVDEVAADYLERAAAAQKRRRDAPRTGVIGTIEIPQKSAIERFSRDTGGQDGEFHLWFGDRKKADADADRGNEPVMHQGKQYEIDGDPMWRMPIDLHNADMAQNVAQSASMLRSRRLERTSGSPDSSDAVTIKDGTGHTILETSSDGVPA